MTEEAKKRKRTGRKRDQRTVPAVKIEQCRALLAYLYPNCFARKGAKNKKPLKVGIGDDLRAKLPSVAPGLSNRVLKATLRDYCTGGRYLRSLCANAHRVDLDGEPCGIVDQREADHATKMLRRLNKKGSAKTRKAA